MEGNAAQLLEAAERADSLLRNALADPDTSLLTDEELLRLGEVTERLAARLQALSTRTLADVEQRDAAQHVHGVRTSCWLRERHGHSARQAVAVLREAAHTVQATLVWRALADATISPRQAAVALKALRLLPAELTPGQEIAAQHTLLEQAQRFDPAELAVLGNRLIEVIYPDHADVLLELRLEREEGAARRSQELHLRPDGMGSMLLRGKLIWSAGERLAALLDSLVDRADHNEPPQCGPACPGPCCGLCGGRPSPAMRRASALLELAAAHTDARSAPSRGADRARMNLTVPLTALRTGIGGLDLAGQPLSAQQTRLLACDATIIPMVLDDLGVPLAVGRARRLFDRELRDALIARDGGCAFPGCDSPPRSCDAHHVLPWWWDGETRLDNGVLLCPQHHALVEPGRRELHNPNRWEVRLGAQDRLPEFLPPQALDRARSPRRHLRYRLRAGPRGGDAEDGADPLDTVAARPARGT